MTRIMFVLVAALVVGCMSPREEKPHDTYALPDAHGYLEEQMVMRGGSVPEFARIATDECERLPIVSFTIGEPQQRAVRGEETWVPVYIDSDDMGSFGALLFVELSGFESPVGSVEIRPGPGFTATPTGFYSALGHSHTPYRINMLIVGWREYRDGEFLPLTVEDLEKPLFWFPVRPTRLGLGRITWDALPEELPALGEGAFFRRSEMLVERLCWTSSNGSHTWDVLDYYTSPRFGFNTTGTTTVKDARIVVLPR